jgi:LysM repeat protein
MALKGIDVASWQSGLNLHNIDYDFVVVKATEGTGYINPCCDMHVQQAIEMGKLFGVYHYANGGDAIAESNYFIQNVQGYLKHGILVLDFEAESNAAWNVNPNGWVKTWCDNVYNQTGVRPLVYIQASALNKVSGIGDYGLWVAQYASTEPTYYQDTPWNEGAYDCAMRQYAGGNGRVYGYDGGVDLDKFYGDAEAWMKYANPSGDYVAPTPVQPTPQPQQATGTVYVVQAGDTLSEIAQRYGTTYQHLAAINGIADPNIIHVGDRIVIDGVVPAQSSDEEYYTIQPGDTLSGIAERYGTSYQYLAYINGISDPNKIYAGDTIRVR